MYIRILVAIGAIFYFSPLYALDNVVFGKPVHEAGGPFGIGIEQPGVPPEIIADGSFVEPGDGDPWYAGSWWVEGICELLPPPSPENPEPPPKPCALEIDLEGDFRIYSLFFQGDSNDFYSLEYWDHGLPGWQPVWLVPPGTIEGISTRGEEFLIEPIITNRLRIVGVDGDGQYGVSEVQAFGERLDPCIQAGGLSVNFGCSSEAPEYETHVAAGEFCYRFKFSCDALVEGGFGACVFPNGFFDFGMGAQIQPGPDDPPPGPENPNCGVGGGHMLNNKVEHSCSLDGLGKVKLTVKQVGMVHCEG